MRYGTDSQCISLTRLETTTDTEINGYKIHFRMFIYLGAVAVARIRLVVAEEYNEFE